MSVKDERSRALKIWRSTGRRGGRSARRDSKPQLRGKLKELRDEYPDLVKKIEESARAEGAQAERERIRAIEELPAAGQEDLVRELKYQSGATADSVARELLASQKLGRQERLSARREDEERMDAPGPAPRDTGAPADEGEQAAAFILSVKEP